MNIDRNGIQIDTFEEIFESISTQFKDIYGQDINISQESPDGQMIGILTNTVYDLQTMIVRIYNSFDPDFAQGQELNKILKLISETRNPPTKSTVDIEITTNTVVTLPAGFTVKDDNDNEWVTTKEEQLTVGVNTVTFEASLFGSISAIENSITTPVDAYTEIDSFTNPASAVTGRDEESDTSLRVRRNKLLTVNAKSTIGGISAKLVALENVTDARIYENYTDTYDSDKQLDAHSIWCVVDGGDIDEIAEVIAKDKTIGTGLKGSTTGTWLEEFVKSDGTVRYFTHEINFDRPNEIDLYISFSYKKRNALDTIDEDYIKNQLALLTFDIDADLNATELYAEIYGISSLIIAFDLLVSTDGVNWVDDILELDYGEKLTLSTDNITLTEVV